MGKFIIGIDQNFPYNHNELVFIFYQIFCKFYEETRYIWSHHPTIYGWIVNTPNIELKLWSCKYIPPKLWGTIIYKYRNFTSGAA